MCRAAESALVVGPPHPIERLTLNPPRQENDHVRHVRRPNGRTNQIRSRPAFGRSQLAEHGTDGNARRVHAAESRRHDLCARLERRTKRHAAHLQEVSLGRDLLIAPGLREMRIDDPVRAAIRGHRARREIRVGPEDRDAAVGVDRANHPDETFGRDDGRLRLDASARADGQRSRVLFTNVRDAQRLGRHESPLQLAAQA